jgi:hypothetical protein
MILLQAVVHADDVVWQPVVPGPGPASEATTAASTASTSFPTAAATLGPPQALDGTESTAPVPVTLSDLSPVVYREPSSSGASTVTCEQAPDGAAAAPAAGAYNEGVVVGQPLGHSFWDRCKGIFCDCGERTSQSGRCPLQSDHCFDALASPLTNPIFFEDPRALTELRPIFFYQGAPRSNPFWRGGNSELFGTQARIAFTERLSFVLNELGFVTFDPFGGSPLFTKSTGFAQVAMGPKYTFYRCPDSGSVLGSGLYFFIPAGSSTVYQNVGTLSLVPYLSYGQTFGQWPRGWGSFNLIANTGYSFSINHQRADFFYANLHVDYNIANLNHFYPFLEMNYFHYTQAGRANNFGSGFEGLDLANFGNNTLGGRDFLAISPGIRFKLNEHIQTGIAVSWPLLRQKELNDYRLTVDVIFRY